MQIIRSRVLEAFKRLHKARKVVFEGDCIALDAARRRINEDFKKNKNVTNQAAVEELLKFAQEIERELYSSVVQAVEVKEGVYQLNLRPEVTRLDNVPYNECSNIPASTASKCSNYERDKH